MKVIFVIATWYFLMGNTMANGDKFTNDMTCASWDFPLNAMLRVTNIINKKSIVVKNTDRINRRFKGLRIDLSRKAFSKIAHPIVGVVDVKVERLK